MTSIVVEGRQSAQAWSPVFTGAARWRAAALLTVGGLLQMVEFALEHGDDPVARIGYWSEHLTRVGVAMAVGLLAVPFLIGGVLTLVAMTRQRSPRISAVAGSLMVAAMVGLAAIHGAEQSAYWLLRAGNPAAAVQVLGASDVGLPGAALMAMFLGGAALGSLAMTIALLRSPYIPRLTVVFFVVFFVCDIALGHPVVAHALALVWAAVAAWAALTGYVRRPRATARAVSRAE